jgi:signal-transduction protein with cAMP-binding, CBS, and nucleotidyltransferase domain
MERLGEAAASPRRGVVLAVQDISTPTREKEDEKEEEVDTVVEELRGLSHLRIKPRVVISDAKHKKTTGSTAQVANVAPTAASSGIIERGRLCSVYAIQS